jgi:hypothetical protein
MSVYRKTSLPGVREANTAAGFKFHDWKEIPKLNQVFFM